MTKQIPQGYKQTKVGVIPEDWDVLTINQLVNMSYLYKPLDGNHGDIHPKSSDFVASGIPFIMANNVRNGILDLENCAFITKKQADRLQKGFSITGDVLLTHKGTVGNVVMVKNLYTDYIMLTPQVTYYRVKDHSQLNRHYIFQYFLSKIFQQKLEEIAGGGTRAYIGITEQRNLPFILPPLKEQEIIAEILSTWDGIIAKQEQLIEQKHVFKKGIMQQIFSQKIRFKDDNGNDYPTWQTKKLGDIAKISTGSSNREDSTEEDGKYTFFDRSQDIRTSNIYLFDCEAVIVAGEGQEFTPKYFIGKFDLHQRTYAIYDFTKASGLFIYYYLHQYKNYFFSQSVGSTVKSLRLPMFIKMPISLPLPAEQTKIADFLTSIDDETTKQTEILDQLKLQKQSLMQKLLTGQVRTKI